MMACNDLQLANEALSDWKQEQPNSKRYRQQGAQMYFVRLQLGHLYEALKIISEINQDNDLRDVVNLCDSRTQESFSALMQLSHGDSNKRFEELVGRVRHNLVFHYEQSGKLITKALKDRASRPEARNTSVTRGNHAYLWHFKVADDIVDSIVTRQIWRIPRDADLREEADKVADYVHEVLIQFADFAGEFIWKYFTRRDQ